MKYSYTFGEIRAAERAAAEAGITAEALMERAGTALAGAVLAVMKTRKIDDVMFVCGGGNNGGDGFVAARVLCEQGVDAAVLCLAKKFSHECAEAAEKYRGVLFGRIPRRRYALIVDCIFGTGITRPPEGDAAALIEFIRTSGAYVIACDLPSGLSESGVAYSPCVKADKTFSIGGLKSALLLSDGADLAGETETLDIGISPQGGAEIWEEKDVREYFPERKSHSDKGDYGKAVILAGYGSLGAPVLAAGAALKSGAGYTELRIPSFGSRETDELYRTVFTAKYPACIVGGYTGEAIRAEAVAFGMGAGQGPAPRGMLESLLTEYRCGTLVLDADALNGLEVSGAEVLRRKQCPVVITPHIKEFSRITGRTVEEILADPMGIASGFAKEYGVTVVLKNNRTVITDGERKAINMSGTPALAKGGSGDVLAGFLAGTCARGVAPYEAACVSAYLLGRAGELAASRLGEYSVDAEDVIGSFPESIASLKRDRTE